MYQYKAYSPEKKLVEGTIDASSENMAEEFLRKAGYIDVLTLKEKTPRRGILSSLRLRRVNKADIVELFQQLATLIDSRMPVVQALSLLADQTPQTELKEIINKLGERLSSGLSLSQAMSWYPQFIPAHYREVIRVSEQSGNIPLGLRLVAGYMEKENAVTKNLTRTLRDDPLLHLLAHALLDGRDELVGDRPPLHRVDEVEALPALAGAIRRWTSPNWPRPPVCFLCRWLASASPVIVSR